MWEEGVATLVYVPNIYLKTSVKDTLPQEAWDGKKVNVSHF